MTDIQQQIKTLEATIDEAKKAVALMSTMEALHNNKEFNEIIDEQLFKNYAQSLVHLLSDPARQSEAEREDIIKEMEMIGRLRQFLHSLYQTGRMAEKQIADCQEQINELREME